MRKILLWFILGGMVYLPMEAFFRIHSNGGWAHYSMFIVSGLIFAVIGIINQSQTFYTLSMHAQAVIGAAIILAIEFVSGVVLNIWLKLGIWDYSHLWGNVAGQICIPMAIVWLSLMPFAIWMEDRSELVYYICNETLNGHPVKLFIDGRLPKEIRMRIFNSDKYVDLYTYTLWDAYKEFFDEVPP